MHSDSSAAITDPKDFLRLSSDQLDEVFRHSTPGQIPSGEGDGTAIIVPGTSVSDPIARFVHLFSWKGKVFELDPTDPDRAKLQNRILPLGTKAIIAEVYRAESWFDGQPAIVLDYSQTSLVAQWVRDEIREVSPGLYLGIVFWGKERETAEKLIHFALRF